MAVSHMAVSDAELLFLAYASKGQQGSGPWSGRCMNIAQVCLLASGLSSIASGTAASVVSLLIISLRWLFVSFLESLLLAHKCIQHVPQPGLPLKNTTREGRWTDSPLMGSFPLLHVLCLWMTTLQIANLKKNQQPTVLLLPQHVLLWFLGTGLPGPWHCLAGPCVSSIHQKANMTNSSGPFSAGGSAKMISFGKRMWWAGWAVKLLLCF